MRVPIKVPAGTLVGEDGRPMSMRRGYPELTKVPAWMAALVRPPSARATAEALRAHGLAVEWVLIEVPPQPERLRAFRLCECPDDARLLFIDLDSSGQLVRLVVACDT